MLVTVADVRDGAKMWFDGLNPAPELHIRTDGGTVIVRMTDEQVRQLVESGNRHMDRRMLERARVVRRNQTILRCDGPGCGVALTPSMGLIVDGSGEDTVFCSLACRANRGAHKRQTAPVGGAVGT